MQENLLYALLFINLSLSIPLIRFLRNKGFYKTKLLPTNKKVKRNPAYYRHLSEYMNTPSSFGVLFILNMIVLLFTDLSVEIKAVAVTAIFLGLLGLADDIYQFFLYRKSGEWGFRARYKMAFQLIAFFILFFYLNHLLLLSVILAAISTFVLNSFNITDGLDGLAGGVAIPTLLSFALFEYSKYGLTSSFYLASATLLFLVTFMIFNVKPAKVWLGDSGSYSIGTILAFLAITADWRLALVSMSIFLLEGLSSLFQILSIKIFKKKLFKIAPVHLHLLNSGWSQWKVIGSAWVVQLILVTLIYVAIQNGG